MIDRVNMVKNGLLLLLVVCVIMLLLDKGCSKNIINTITDPEVISTKTTKDSVRTHYIHKIDTFEKIVSVPFETVIYISVDSNRVDPNDSTVLFNTYTYKKEDSLLDYTIEVDNNIKPRDVRIEYDVKQHIIKDYVYIRDSIFVKQEDKVRVNQLYFGGEAVVYPAFKGAFVGLDFVSKKGWQVEGAVGIDLDGGSPMGKVGLKKLITFRKNK